MSGKEKSGKNKNKQDQAQGENQNNEQSNSSLDANADNVVTLEHALQLAQGHHRSRNFILAERTYRDILNTVQDHYPTVHNLGILLFQNGNFEDAKKYIQKAVDADPENPDCWCNFGAVLTQLLEYEEAINAYDKAIAINEEHSDAINNKTFVLWAMEKYEEALKIAESYLEKFPEDASALSNYGMALAKLNRRKDALEVWKKVSNITPDDAMIWTNWGNTLWEMGRVAAAETPCRKAVELDPNNPEALNNLANVLRDLGDNDGAEEYYLKATDVRPDFPEAHNNRSIMYLDKEDYKKAARSARYAIAFKKDFGAPYSNLAKALLALGDFTQAHSIAQRAVTLNPEKADAYLDLADVLLRSDRLDDGDAALQEALKRDPDSARCFMKLAEVKDLMNEAEEALEYIDKALELSPKMPVISLRKARILISVNKIQEALDLLDAVIEDAPNMLAAYHSKAESLISLNENEKALEVVREVLRRDETLPAPYFTLKSLKKFTSEDDDDLKAILRIEEGIEDRSVEEKIVLYYTLADIYDQLKQYEKAFSYSEQANNLKRQQVPYDPTRIAPTYAGVKEYYTPELFEHYEGKGHDSDVPIFIVGMPRSGTTLTEQIISSHPEVFGAGELSYISQVRGKNVTAIENDPKEMGKRYLEMASKLNPDGKAKRITDKMPGNYTNVGFISIIFPNAKIIHCSRNPIDTCLSCYQQNFARGQYWSYNLEELAVEYKRYLDLMAYWREVLPGRFLDINYEDTVNNFEEQARKLIDFVGLEWNDACLEPHKQKRAVLTASKGQVTQPIYKSSVEKWKRYEKQLQPLVRELQPDKALPEQAA